MMKNRTRGLAAAGILFFACSAWIFSSGTAWPTEKLSLDQSIQIALDQSPTVQRAKADIRAAEGKAGQAFGEFLPQLSVDGSFGKYFLAPSSTQITVSGTPTVFTMGVDEVADTDNYKATFSQIIYTGGRASNLLRMANKGQLIAREELRRVNQDVQFDTVSAYYNVIKTQKTVELRQLSQEMAKKHLVHARELFKAGLATRSDVLRAEVQVAQADVLYLRATQNLELAKNNFNYTLGNDLELPVELADVDFGPEEAVLYSYAELKELAFEYRPEWRQFVLGVKVKEDETRVAFSTLLPSISLAGSYSGGSTRYSAFQSITRGWAAQLTGGWDIFDGTINWNKVKEANANLDSARAKELDMQRVVALEVKDANFQLESAKVNVDEAKKAVLLAEENNKIAEMRYNAGAGNSLEVIDAQVELTRARYNLVEVQYSLQVAKAKVNRTVGTDVYSRFQKTGGVS